MEAERKREDLFVHTMAEEGANQREHNLYQILFQGQPIAIFNSRFNGINLVITTDCGISCYNEVEIANQYGIDIIITDHHSVPEKEPQAFSIIHPKHENLDYPFKELTFWRTILARQSFMCMFA